MKDEDQTHRDFKAKKDHWGHFVKLSNKLSPQEIKNSK